jgi:arylsulfatase A-like enzyme
LPPLPENHAVPDDEPDAIRAFQDRRPKYVLERRWDEQRTREYLWGYYRLVEMVDAEIGRTLGALIDAGLDDNTVVLFGSDHGDGHGCHRWNQKWTLYDESARVPFVVAAPSCADPGGVCDLPASAMLDLMPTILDYAGVAVPDGCRGESVRPVVDGTGTPDREFVVCDTYLDKTTELGQGEFVAGRMVRTERYKYVAFAEGERREQFTDMQADPGEMHNLASDPAHRDALERHRALLRDWCERTGDSF